MPLSLKIGSVENIAVATTGGSQAAQRSLQSSRPQTETSVASAFETETDITVGL